MTTEVLAPPVQSTPAAAAVIAVVPQTMPAFAPEKRPEFRPIEEELRELEIKRISEALDASGGNQRRAAQLIGMPLRTFVAKMKPILGSVCIRLPNRSRHATAADGLQHSFLRESLLMRCLKLSAQHEVDFKRSSRRL